MAHAATDTTRTGLVPGAFSRFFTALFDGLISLSAHDHRAQQLERLARLNDAQLSRRGLKREELAYRVFGGQAYL